MKLTPTQKLLKKHSNRIWTSFKRMCGVYCNGEDGLVYKFIVDEFEDVPEFPECSSEKEPMIVVSLHDITDRNSTKVIPLLSSRKAMDSTYELEQVEQAYEDFLHFTGANPSSKFYKMLEEIRGIFKISEEDEALWL